MRRIRKTLIMAAVGLLASSALPAAVPSGEGWQQLETENFIVFSNLDAEATKEIGLDLERLKGVLGVIFPRAKLAFAPGWHFPHVSGMFATLTIEAGSSSDRMSCTP